MKWVKDSKKNKHPHVQFVLSGVAGSEPTACQSVLDSNVVDCSDLDSDLEEADVRIIPRIL